MKTLYFDCFSGISGDMTIAALLDLGCSRKNLESELRKLGVSHEYDLHIGRSKQHQVTGLKFDVHTPEELKHHSPKSRSSSGVSIHSHSHGSTFVDIRRMIERSKLSSFVRQHSIQIFQRIAGVEGKIHGVPTEKVHFHEVGAIDSIVDIVGVCILIEELGPKQILSSTPSEGHGFVECAHGRFPVPTTATLELLKGIRFRQIDVSGELITPTGAAILAEFVSSFGPIPAMTIQKIGYGLGSRVYSHHPNVLRVLWGEAEKTSQKNNSDSAIDILETNVDDLSPEILASAMERLFDEGAKDVFFTSVQMKKGRPGTLVTVLASPLDTERLSEILFQETGSFGLRIRRSDRVCLEREFRTIQTPYGRIKIKLGIRGGKIMTAKPEFESCREVAKKARKAVRLVWTVALAECAKILQES